MPNKNTPLFPKVAYWHDTLPSTNTAAVAAIQGSHPPEHGAVFWAHAQSAGRGQGNNQWHTTPGENLTLSVVAYPQVLLAKRLFQLTQLTGLAVRATVSHFQNTDTDEAVSVKWPNDVYIGEHKVAGILVQNGLRGDKVSWSVMGIGLNVNEKDFPESIAHRATSIRLSSGKSHSLKTVADYLFQQLTFHYELLQPDGVNALNEAYHDHLYRKDISSNFQLTANGALFKGVIRGVNQHGQLRVEQPVGRESAFSVGEIKLLP
ncbi:MAG: biotin--[acetyl-CoA-carboxylase] ligase [Bacteroidota bacterium]